MASISGYNRSHFTIETEDLDKGGIRNVVAVPNGRILVYLQPFADGSPVLHLTPDEAVALTIAILKVLREEVVR